VFRSHWRELAFWKWWWTKRASLELRLGSYLFLLVLLLAGGWLAASRLSSAGAVPESYVLETTLLRTVTVRQQGKLVKKVVRVVKRVRVHPETVFKTETAFGTQFVTTPRGVRVVRQRVVKYVPRVRNRIVTINGKTKTVSETRLVPTTTVETRTETATVAGPGRTVTETDSRTAVVTTERTVVDEKTVTEMETRTVTQPVTVTHTETLPPDTVTVVVTTIETVTEP
jgi:hypothetical protein